MNEGTQLDMNTFIANMCDDAGLGAWYTMTFKKWDDEFYKWFLLLLPILSLYFEREKPLSICSYYFN